MDEELIIGKNPVLEALRARRTINKVLVSEQIQEGTLKQIQSMSKQADVVVQRVPKSKLNQLTSGQHQGIIAFVASYHYASLDDLFAIARERKEQPFFIILDELEDPHNLGSIMRTADATGAHGIIIPKRRAVGLTATVAKTSTGAIEYIPVVRVTNMIDTMKELKNRHVWIVGTDGSAKEDYRSLDGSTPIALVIGSEGKGMSRLVKQTCDWTVSLPMEGKVTSLNASVASGILLYEIYRKRNPLGD